ncbi:hypothetical protein SISNIDRAFT_467940 [Sistotremastrum niveocremeum HHB9708]|uniref:Uncharacterized protein n=1 Tax=Sistotremastrum niveocremeum HHB9708 TaxID=1314777 RepID=A0A164RYW3_9AGAM|nr:hypothetical protein SISNIDRAFT_467940 [Sistotremastrum niveocremeum HHB9708]
MDVKDRTGRGGWAAVEVKEGERGVATNEEKIIRKCSRHPNRHRPRNLPFRPSPPSPSRELIQRKLPANRLSFTIYEECNAELNLREEGERGGGTNLAGLEAVADPSEEDVRLELKFPKSSSSTSRRRDFEGRKRDFILNFLLIFPNVPLSPSSPSPVKVGEADRAEDEEVMIGHPEALDVQFHIDVEAEADAEVDEAKGSVERKRGSSHTSLPVLISLSLSSLDMRIEGPAENSEKGAMSIERSSVDDEGSNGVEVVDGLVGEKKERWDVWRCNGCSRERTGREAIDLNGLCLPVSLNATPVWPKTSTEMVRRWRRRRRRGRAVEGSSASATATTDGRKRQQRDNSPRLKGAGSREWKDWVDGKGQLGYRSRAGSVTLLLSAWLVENSQLSERYECEVISDLNPRETLIPSCVEAECGGDKTAITLTKTSIIRLDYMAYVAALRHKDNQPTNRLPTPSIAQRSTCLCTYVHGMRDTASSKRTPHAKMKIKMDSEIKMGWDLGALLE